MKGEAMTNPLLNIGAELDSDAAVRLLEHVFETNSKTRS